MPGALRWEQRFLGTTRGQVILLLRRARRTVDELAAHLGLTDNAVRSHLATLERDGLVSQAGQRRGEGGKPATFYALTPEAEHLFPKAYGLILRELLDVLGTRLFATEVEAVLRDVGRWLAAGYTAGAAAASPAERVQRAVQVLDALGGFAAAEPNPADAAQTDRVRAVPDPANPARADPAPVDPARVDAARADAARVDAARSAAPPAAPAADDPATVNLAPLDPTPVGRPPAGLATVTIYGYACPLAEALPGHPAVCRLAETLLGEVSGLPVSEQCDRGAEGAHCRFVVRLDAEPAR